MLTRSLLNLRLWPWAALAAFAVSGCSYGGFAPSQEIAVEVESAVPEAPLPLSCEAVNDRGNWLFVAPGKVLVAVTSEPLRITCKAPANVGAETALTGPTETLYPSAAHRNVGIGVSFTVGLAAVMRGFSATVIAPIRAASDEASMGASLRYPAKVVLHLVRDDTSRATSASPSPQQ